MALTGPALKMWGHHRPYIPGKQKLEQNENLYSWKIEIISQNSLINLSLSYIDLADHGRICDLWRRNESNVQIFQEFFWPSNLK